MTGWGASLTGVDGAVVSTGVYAAWAVSNSGAPLVAAIGAGWEWNGACAWMA